MIMNEEEVRLQQANFRVLFSVFLCRIGTNVLERSGRFLYHQL